MSIKNKYNIDVIKSEETYDWLLNKHYAKRIPSISYAFGLFEDRVLQGICTYGKPPSNSLCEGICGNEYSSNVYELNRLVINEDLGKNVLSYFVSNTIKLLPEDFILVSYADTSQNHNGYIYQATNWLYTGLSDKRTEWRIKGSNKHSKTICEQYTLEERQGNPDKFEVVDRPQKHRYVYFKNRKMIKQLKYKIYEYPKGENKRYDASHKPKIQDRLF